MGIERILVVEDNYEMRDWMSALAARVFPRAELAVRADTRSALAACLRDPIDLALVDLGLPDGSGFDVIRRLVAVRPQAIPVVTTAMASDTAIVGALSAGARGYLLKSEPEARLERQLRQITEGIPAISPPIARRIMEHFQRTGPSEELDGSLTRREREVLSLIARGLRIADAALALDVAESTVASHVKNIYRKLGIASRAEATLMASRLGLVGGGERD
ncbi:response regulator transcription factor [Tropicimonas sp. IMCC34011]|uniref:response regulator transcription factor n=1 Tax=Tropicimonas sp. IMCC34011 TaxID=2248759 RepID=UPI000E23D6A9|nr:response regulator transcription factor [Tropicimonas sp. IMCC34011]